MGFGAKPYTLTKADIDAVLGYDVDLHAGRHASGQPDVVSVAGLSGLLADPQVAQTHGASRHTDITRELLIPASEGHIVAGTLTNKGVYAAVRGEANTVTPKVYVTTKVPDDFLTFQSLKAVWLSGAAAGNMYWSLWTYYAAEGEAYNIHTSTYGYGVTATGGDDIMNYQEAPTPPNLTALAVGDLLGILFRRDGSHVQDTLDLPMYLFGVLFTYTASQ